MSDAKPDALTDAQRELAERWRGLAFRLAFQAWAGCHCRCPDLLAEAQGEALLHLCLAARSYDPAIASFSTLATVSLRRRLWTFLAREMRRRSRSRQPPPDAAGLEPADPSAARHAERAEAAEEAARVMEQAAPVQRLLLRDLLEADGCQAAVARRWRVSPERVRQRLQRVRERLDRVRRKGEG